MIGWCFIGMSDDEGERVRLSVGFPVSIYTGLETVAKRQHRPISSVVLEACELFLEGGVKREVLEFLGSPEGRKLILNLVREEEENKG